MEIRRRVGTNIRRIRLGLRLTQEELSARSTVHQTYLSNVEAGKRNPSILVLERIADGLGVDVADLFKADK